MGAGASDLNGGAARRRGTRLRRAGLLLAAAALAGCAQSRGPDSGPIAQAPADQPAAQAAAKPGAGGRVSLSAPAPVALLLPLGAEDPGAAEAARDMADAARLAAKDAPGLVALDIRDTFGKAGAAAAAVRAAAAAGDALILGPLYAASAEAAGAAAAADGLNLISFSNTPSAAGGNVWLIGRLAEGEADRIIGHAVRRGFARIGLYHPRNALGEVAREAARRAAARHGAVLAPVMAYPRSFEGIRDSAEAYAEAHRAAGAQAALLPDTGQGLQAAASFLRYHDIGASQDSLLLGLGGWGAPAMARESSLARGRFAAPDPERLAAFAERFEAAYGRAPAPLAWLAHDAARAAAGMMASARSRGDERPFGAAEIADPGGFYGAGGLFRFTPDGLNERALAVVEVGRDGFEVIEPAPRTLGAPGA